MVQDWRKGLYIELLETTYKIPPQTVVTKGSLSLWLSGQIHKEAVTLVAGFRTTLPSPLSVKEKFFPQNRAYFIIRIS